MHQTCNFIYAHCYDSQLMICVSCYCIIHTRAVSVAFCSVCVHALFSVCIMHNVMQYKISIEKNNY